MSNPSNKKIKLLVTAGPTREWLDPIRFMSNPSTGVMGYEIARAGVELGFSVTLISGPTHLTPPKGVRFISIETAKELQSALKKTFPKHDLLFMTAAIGDYTPVKLNKQKIKRVPTLTVKLKHTPDVIAGIAKQKKHQTIVGFCLETKNLIANAKQKMKNKNLDFIVANYLGKNSNPFGSGNTKVVLMDALGKKKEFKNVSKKVLGKKLLLEVITAVTVT